MHRTWTLQQSFAKTPATVGTIPNELPYSNKINNNWPNLFRLHRPFRCRQTCCRNTTHRLLPHRSKFNIEMGMGVLQSSCSVRSIRSENSPQPNTRHCGHRLWTARHSTRRRERIPSTWLPDIHWRLITLWKQQLAWRSPPAGNSSIPKTQWWASQRTLRTKRLSSASTERSSQTAIDSRTADEKRAWAMCNLQPMLEPCWCISKMTRWKSRSDLCSSTTKTDIQRTQNTTTVSRITGNIYKKFELNKIQLSNTLIICN